MVASQSCELYRATRKCGTDIHTVWLPPKSHKKPEECSKLFPFSGEAEGTSFGPIAASFRFRDRCGVEQVHDEKERVGVCVETSEFTFS